MKLSLFEFWCFLALLALPLFQITQIDVGGIGVGAFELLLPIQFVILAIYIFRPRFKLHQGQIYAFFVFLILLVLQYLVSVFFHEASVVSAIKIVIGQTAVFLVFIFFSRIARSKIPLFVEGLSLIGALVVIISVLFWPASSSSRLDSIFWGRTNAFAAALVPIILAGVVTYLLFHKKRILIFSFICFIGLLLTQSRGGFISLLSGLALLMFIYLNHRQRTTFIIIIPILMLLLFGLINIESVRNRIPVLGRIGEDIQVMSDFLTFRDQSDQRQVMSGRLYYWQSAISSIQQNPFYGTNQFVLYIPQWSDSQTTLSDKEIFAYHNSLLSMTARWGLWILLINLAFLLLALVPYWRFRHNKNMQVWAVILVAALFHSLFEPIFDTGFLNFNVVSLVFWMIAGLGYRLHHNAAFARVENNDYQNKALKSSIPLTLR